MGVLSGVVGKFVRVGMVWFILLFFFLWLSKIGLGVVEMDGKENRTSSAFVSCFLFLFFLNSFLG